MGWGLLDVLGCDPVAPAARLNRAGLALLLRGDQVMALTAGCATIRCRSGALHVYRRRPMEGAVLLSELGLAPR